MSEEEFDQLVSAERAMALGHPRRLVDDLAEPEVAFPHYIKYANELMARAGVKRG